MIRKRLVFAAVLALVAFVLTATSAYGHGVQVPIHGSYSGTAAFTDASHMTAVFNGTGISSHLGRGTNQGNAVITGQDSSGCLDNVNIETLTAANGDSITLTSTDVACPVAPGVVHGTGSWKVTGGTGRFLNATGKGTLDGYADFSKGTFSFQLNGMISAPNGG